MAQFIFVFCQQLMPQYFFSGGFYFLKYSQPISSLNATVEYQVWKQNKIVYRDSCSFTFIPSTGNVIHVVVQKRGRGQDRYNHILQRQFRLGIWGYKVPGTVNDLKQEGFFFFFS